jgi:PEP-CTERM motif
MNVRLLVTLLLGTALIFVAPAQANSIRTGSNYGMPNSSTSSTSVGTQFLVPLTPISATDFDVLLQISSTSPFLGDPLQVTLDLSGTPFVIGTTAFGLINCTTSVGNLTTPCGSSTSNGTGCNLSGVTDVGGTITIPGSCDVAGMVFYFDEASTTGVFADVSPLTPSVAPEPSSLALIGISLISLALFSRRRLQP